MKTCKEIVKTISSEEPRSWTVKLEIRFHLMICRHCGKYAKHIEMIKAGFKKSFKSVTAKVSEDQVRKIESKVLDNIKK